MAQRVVHYGDPKARITRVGRFSYEVVILPYGWSWQVLGRQRAEKKARKQLGKLKQKSDWKLRSRDIE